MEFDFGTIIFFAAFLWFLISEIRPKKKQPRPGAAPPNRRPADPPVRYTDPAGERAAGLRYDAELERRRLERLLKGLDPDGGPIIVSLETEPVRVERVEEVYDDRAEAASRARIEAARERDRALNAADHAAFDRRIRRPARVTAGRSRPRPDLRDAIVWREILGPPVSLRED